MRWHEVSALLSRLEGVRARKRLVEAFAGLFRGADAGEAKALSYLLAGRLWPPFAGPEFGLDERLVSVAVARAQGEAPETVWERYRQVGDFGTLLMQAGDGRPSELSVAEVHRRLGEIASQSGPGSLDRKINGLSHLLGRMSAEEAAMLVRIPLRKLRLGVGEALLMDALAEAFRVERGWVERAFNLGGDLGQVAQALAVGGVEALKAWRMCAGQPIKMALAERAESAAAIIRRHGETAVEPKYDGFRCQIHLFEGRAVIFSRGLDETTAMLPDIAQGALAQIHDLPAIVEGEAVGFDPKTGDFHPFQVTAQRKRKHQVAEMREQLPLRLFVFDLLMRGGESLVERPYLERRARLEAILTPGGTLELAESHLVRDVAQLEQLFEEAIAKGLEGIMAKRPDSPYEAGKRGFDWLKLKRVQGSRLADTVDAVIVGYDRGRGRRGSWGIGSVLLAVYDSDQDRFFTLARAASGLTDGQWLELRETLDAVALAEPDPHVESLYRPDVWVEPRYVVEVVADEITASPLHTAGKAGTGHGFALRFPRLTGMPKAERHPDEATTVAEVARLYRLQRVR